jgi:Fe-Mn family superoxide dismutase
MCGHHVSGIPLHSVAPRVTVAALRHAMRSQPPPIVLDVRRRPVFLESATMIPGADWRDPTLVYEWGSALPQGRLIVVYCVHGLHVGRWAAASLRAQGRDAWFLDGGIAAWEAAGNPLTARDGGKS